MWSGDDRVVELKFCAVVVRLVAVSDNVTLPTVVPYPFIKVVFAIATKDIYNDVDINIPQNM